MTYPTTPIAAPRWTPFAWLVRLFSRRPAACRTCDYETLCARARADMLDAIDNGYTVDGSDAIARLPRHAQAYARTMIDRGMLI